MQIERSSLCGAVDAIVGRVSVFMLWNNNKTAKAQLAVERDANYSPFFRWLFCVFVLQFVYGSVFCFRCRCCCMCFLVNYIVRNYMEDVPTTDILFSLLLSGWFRQIMQKKHEHSPQCAPL